MTPISRWPPKSVTLEWEGIRLYKGSRIQRQRDGKDQTQGQDNVKEMGEKSGSFSFLSSFFLFVYSSRTDFTRTTTTFI